MNGKSTAWSPYADQLLRDLWMAHSAAEIADTISAASQRPINRKAVIGRAFRLGLPRKKPSAKPARAPRVRPPAPRPRPVRRHFARPHFPAEPIAPRDFEKVAPTRTLETLGRHECRFPIGDVGEPDFGFCGRLANGPYCPLHRAVVFLPVSRRPRPFASESGRTCAGDGA